MSSYIGLVDCNNFFVSCERLFRPDLQQQPVVVLSSNDGCVVARSQEVKDIGVPMGVPYFKIKDIIKDKAITVFSGNITLYRDISRRVFDIVRQEFAVVEQYSIDEAFFEVSETICEQCLHKVRDRIMAEVGIPVSIGLAPSKTIAKIATDEAKQGSGVAHLTEEAWGPMTDGVPLPTVWGIGRRLAQQYKDAGLQTVADLLQADPALLRQRFGVVAVRQQMELSGEVAYPVTTQRPLQQSLMSSRSFRKPLQDKDSIADAAAYHVRHVAADLRAMQAVAKTIRVSLRTSRHGDFLLRGGSAECELLQGTADTFALLTQAQRLLESLFEPGVPYQKVGVTVSGIQPQAAQQATLFADNSTERSALLAVIDMLNKDNQEVITIGSRLRSAHWQAQAAARSGSYTTRWSDIATVSAS